MANVPSHRDVRMPDSCKAPDLRWIIGPGLSVVFGGEVELEGESSTVIQAVRVWGRVMDKDPLVLMRVELIIGILHRKLGPGDFLRQPQVLVLALLQVTNIEELEPFGK